MDVKRPKNNTPTKRKLYIGAGAFIILIALFFALLQPSASSKVDASSLWLGEVKKGTISLEAKGFGVLESENKRFITTPFSAVVEEILLKPGATVQPDSVILRISNPQIEQDVLQAQLLANAEKAALRQLKLEQQREILQNENELANLEFDLSASEAKYQALLSLAEKGIISQLDLMESKTDFEKQANSIVFVKNKLKKLAELHQQAEQIAKEKLSEKENLLNLALEMKSRLEVKAGMEGVLQSLPVELGQNVPSGGQLALVGGTRELLAVVNIPQRDAQGVTVGMTATVDTRGGKAQALVKRIEPVVKEGNIEVELKLTGTLPSNARPSLNVEAVISVGKLNNVLYVQAPVNSKENTQKSVFKITQNSDQAIQTPINFGARSGKFLVIESGASSNDRIILNDMQKFASKSSLTLIQ
jgi:multidrug resistance efflux pump